ncbi:VanZ family protein [Effusibacillus consociatus]|uniref:VanZ family protein n=1 Tax=Effusibacillus consociatus TaxID=1117041 RepID=A0ABV9Q5H6_9BACL
MSGVNPKEDPFGFIEFLFRKAAHVFIYATLAILTYLLIRPYKTRGIWKGTIILLFIFLIATADEWIQSTTPLRYAAIQDVILDLVGACFGVLLVSREKKSNKPHPASIQ